MSLAPCPPSPFLLLQPGDLVPKGVTDRDAEPLGMIVTELKIVANEVNSRFRPDEKTAEGIKLNARAHIAQQVVAAHKIRAGKCSAGHKVLIKANALAAKTSHQFKRSVLSERWGVHGIDVIEDGPEWSKTAGEVLLGAPRYFAANSKMFEQQEVAAEAGEDSSAYILRKEIAGGVGG